MRAFDTISQAQLKETLSLGGHERVVIFGSYYKKEDLDELAKSHELTQILVHLYLADAKERGIPGDAGASSASKISYETVDAPEEKRAHMPETLKLIDTKGRSDYKSDARMKPFIEWLYTKGCDKHLVHMVIFDASFSLDTALAEGKLYVEKADSLVKSICSAAGWYTTKSGIRVAVVDAHRQIELIGEELCRAQHADLAVITRFDHKSRCTRYTFYATGAVNAVRWARKFGGDEAGGTERISGFISKTPVPQFLEMLESMPAVWEDFKGFVLSNTDNEIRLAFHDLNDFGKLVTAHAIQEIVSAKAHNSLIQTLSQSEEANTLD